MTSNPYDYENRTGVRPVSWEYFHGICKGLAVAVSGFCPEMILPIARGGVYPGMLIAHMLQIEPFTIRVSRRVKDMVKSEAPKWIEEPRPDLKGRRVLVVDDMCSTGETLVIVKQRAREIGVSEVKTAVLYAHARGKDVPDYIGRITDELILNPWDREVFDGCVFRFHPEYVDALVRLKEAPSSSFLIDAPIVSVDKA